MVTSSKGNKITIDLSIMIRTLRMFIIRGLQYITYIQHSFKS